ncbi:MAG: flavodoxin [Oscillospiraceae bacterium]|nr:flavodoxin [Oscillospiraceae bacterium]
MRKIKTIFRVIVCVILIFILSSCGSKASDIKTNDGHEAEEPSQSISDDTASAEKGTLVVVFSATGNTRAVADMIADATGAEVYEILAKEPYSEEDLNWHDKKSRSTIEMNDPDSRPEIGSDKISLDGYSTIYIGYPIWWGEEPRIMDTFVEQYDFTGITMIPFCTSHSSGLGRSGQNLKEKAGTGDWLEGIRFVEHPSEEEVRNWLDSLG